MQKFPPKQKFLEAMTAIADHHVQMGDHQATVRSSNNAKLYTITWDKDTYHSNDNATYWQGYAGYPVLAVLMLQHRLPLDRTIADQFKDVNWHDLNLKYHRNYQKTADAVIIDRGLDHDEIWVAVDDLYDDLKSLPLTLKRLRISHK